MYPSLSLRSYVFNDQNYFVRFVVETIISNVKFYQPDRMLS